MIKGLHIFVENNNQRTNDMKHSVKDHLNRTRIEIDHEEKRVYVVKSKTNVASCGKEQMYKLSFMEFHKAYKENHGVCKRCLVKYNEILKEIKTWQVKGYK